MKDKITITKKDATFILFCEPTTQNKILLKVKMMLDNKLGLDFRTDLAQITYTFLARSGAIVI